MFCDKYKVAIEDKIAEIANYQKQIDACNEYIKSYKQDLFVYLKDYFVSLHPSSSIREEYKDRICIEYLNLNLAIYIYKSGLCSVCNKSSIKEYTNYKQAIDAVKHELPRFFITENDIESGALFKATTCDMYVLILPYGWSTYPKDQLYFIANEHYQPYSNGPHPKEYWATYLSGRYFKVNKSK